MTEVIFKYGDNTHLPHIRIACMGKDVCIIWLRKDSQNPITVLNDCEEMVEDWHEWELPDEYREEDEEEEYDDDDEPEFGDEW
jgi:hypothetical protein